MKRPMIFDSSPESVAFVKGVIEAPMEKRAEWYCELNCWEWPADLPMAKPDGFDNLEQKEKHELPLFNLVIDFIDHQTPEFERCRAWHLGHIGKTEEEFKEWWGRRPKLMVPVD